MSDETHTVDPTYDFVPQKYGFDLDHETARDARRLAYRDQRLEASGVD